MSSHLWNGHIYGDILREHDATAADRFIDANIPESLAAYGFDSGCRKRLTASLPAAVITTDRSEESLASNNALVSAPRHL